MRLINADKLRADVMSWKNCYNGFSDAYDKAMIIDAIDEQPTIKAEPVRRGRWIEDKDRGLHWHCSECAYVIGVMKMDANYCPYCGAKMEDEK